MKTITVNVFNISSVDDKNYLYCIKMPDYKQWARRIKFLRQHVKEQGANDYNFGRIRYYVFQANMWTMRESDLTSTK